MLARAPPLLRVCSYNVLAQAHLETHSHLYRGAPPDALDGPTRLARLTSQLAGLGADVLALQEVEPPVFAALSQALGAYGVRGVYKQRTGAGQPDGVAVFLRTPRLQLLCVEEVEFAALARREPDLIVPPPSAELALRLRRQADKGQVALLVTVLDTQSGARLVVGCTHILFNPSRGAVKLGQVRELVTRAQRGAAAAGAGVVICGDFNCSPTSLLRSYLGGSPVDAPLSEEELWDGSASLKWGRGARRGRGGRAAGRGGGGRHRGGAPADAPRVVAAPHPLADRLRSAYLAAGGREPDATTCHADACGTVDYIMYDARALSPRTLLPTPSLREVLAEGARWPSRQRPSDHVPIACDLEVLVEGGREGRNELTF